MGQATVTESVFVALGDAVKSEIERLTLSMPAIVTRELVPAFDLESLDDLRVVVTGKNETVERVTRGSIDRDVEIEIAVLCRVGQDDRTRADLVLRVADEIAANIRKKRALDLYPGALFVSLSRPDPAYDLDHYLQFGQVSTYATTTWRISEATN